MTGSAFFRTVTPEAWAQGTYPQQQFSVSPEHAARLWELQNATPIPTQIRYFLEYLTTNITGDLPDLQIPMLVINRTPDFEAMMDVQVAAAVEQAGSEAAARGAIEEQIVATYGSLEAAEIAQARPWEPLAEQIEALRLEYLEDSGIFLMDDRPRAFDRLVWELVQALEE